jgi:purine-nucleoside phosphorylase
VVETLRYIQARIEPVPDVLIILGSSFGGVSEKMNVRISLPYESIPHFRKPNAPTHSGNLALGKIADKEVMIMEGRFHVYEGYEVFQTTYPVRMAAALGIKKLITTNLSGGINGSLDIGDFMVVEDHLNLSGVNPLRWGFQKSPGQFTDMYEAYASGLIRLLEEAASVLNIPLRKGVLAYLTGPNFETKAELKMLKILGADAVGWSMVPEVLVARRYGMDVLGLSCISDISDPDRFDVVNLEMLYKAGFDKTDSLFSLLEGFISKL